MLNTLHTTRYACILYYQVTELCFLRKKHEKLKFTIMNPEQIQQADEIRVVHQLNKKFKPFCVLQTNKKFQIVLGNTIASEKSFDSVEQAEKYLATKPYEILFNIACITCQKMKEYEEINRQN